MIHVEQLCKTFKTPKRYPGFSGAIKGLFSREYQYTKAVDDISFHIAQGEIVGYIGANGAGKSTTIKMMTGILTPTSGSVRVAGIVPYEKRMENAARIGVVFGQRTQLWWDLPVHESLTLLRDLYGVSPEEYTERLAFLDGILDLGEFMMSPVRTLSLGQRMRADLAASLLHRPAVLYLDEPTIGLDALVKERVRGAIKKLNREYGTTIVLTTHDLTDIEELCDRIIVIDAGRKVYDGNLVDLRERYGRTRTIHAHISGFDGFDAAPLTGELARLDPSSALVKEKDELIVSFDRSQARIAAVVQAIMKSCDILDYTVDETPIDDIVRRIYSEARQQ
jgi:ABC-2 type transport system ATP-binding protein